MTAPILAIVHDRHVKPQLSESAGREEFRTHPSPTRLSDTWVEHADRRAVAIPHGDGMTFYYVFVPSSPRAAGVTSTRLEDEMWLGLGGAMPPVASGPSAADEGDEARHAFRGAPGRARVRVPSPWWISCRQGPAKGTRPPRF